MQKQTKPKPLGASMAKLVLVVAIIVSLGVALGVAGYLAKNKPKTILTVMPPGQEKVTISTDKTEYEIGEIVKITLENDLDKEINHNYGGCGGYSFNIQKFIDGKWEYLNTFWGACEIIKNYKVESGKSEVYNWDQKAYDDSLAKNSLKQVSSGTYRISITYIADKKVETVYSNEFTIKGKSAKEKIDSLIIGKLNSEEKINVIIYSYDVPTQDMVQALQNISAENVKIIKSEPIKKEGIETVTKDAEPLFITATIKAKNSINIAELSWIRKIILNIEMISQ